MAPLIGALAMGSRKTSYRLPASKRLDLLVMMKKDKMGYAGRLSLAIGGIVIIAVSTPSLLNDIINFGDAQRAPNWLRQEAYQTAVDVALAKADAELGDPTLVQRDFTHERDVTQNGLVSTFGPCGLSLVELPNHIGLGGAKCTASPGVGGVKRDSNCPEKTCVVVRVGDQTWANSAAQGVIVSTLKDHDAVCRYAAKYGSNPRGDAAAAGCGAYKYVPVQIAIEVKPRLPFPCTNIPVTSGNSSLAGEASYRPFCKNTEARLIYLTQ